MVIAAQSGTESGLHAVRTLIMLSLVLFFIFLKKPSWVLTLQLPDVKRRALLKFCFSMEFKNG